MPATSSLSPSPCSIGHRSETHRLSWASLAKSALGAAVVMGGLTAGQSKALVVNVGGQEWDVTTFIGSYNDNTARFQTKLAGGMMPWWGNAPLASAFANAVGGPPLGYGPVFGYSVLTVDFGTNFTTFVNLKQIFNSNLLFTDSVITNSEYVWAQATLIAPSASVPGPLPALGAAAAFGFSRKLRSRIKASSRNAVDVS